MFYVYYITHTNFLLDEKLTQALGKDIQVAKHFLLHITTNYKTFARNLTNNYHNIFNKSIITIHCPVSGRLTAYLCKLSFKNYLITNPNRLSNLSINDI